MRKILFLVVGWLITLSMQAQYNYFDHIEEFDSIGENWFKEVIIDYGLYWRDSVGWQVGYGKENLTKDDVQKLKAIFLQGMAKSSESSHVESHLNGRDSIGITSSSTDIPQEASFHVMGKHVYGPCELRSRFDVEDKNGSFRFWLLQNKTKFEQVEMGTLRMDQTIAAILEETEPKVYEAVFNQKPTLLDEYQISLPGVTDEHIKRTQATIYEFARNAKNKDLYDRLVAAAYEQLYCWERFMFEHHMIPDELILCVKNPQKRGYIAWLVRFEGGRLCIFRAEEEEGFCNVDRWYSEKFLRTQKVIHPQTNQSTSRK